MAAQQPGAILAKTARGVGWIIGWRMTTRLLGVVNTLVLVRFLGPADFGLVALGISLTFSVDALATLGVEDALIRLQAPGREIYDTGFTLNILRSLATAAIIVAAAGPAAGFFGDPRLANVALALAAAIMLGSIANIGTTDFRRNLAFDKEFQLLVLPRICGVAMSISVAVIWHSYWALVASILTTRLTGVAFSYLMHPYRPRLTLRGWRHLAGFSFWTWLISLVALVRERSDNFVIGRILGTQAVGIYEIGFEIAALSISELVGPLARASFPGFAAARHSGLDAAEPYRRMIAAMLLLTLPAGFGASLVADPLVRLAFGPKWQAAIPLAQIMSAAYVVSVLGAVGTTLYSAHALLRPMLGIQLLAAVVRLAFLIGLVQYFGLIGGATAASIAMVVENGGFIVGTMRRFGVRAQDLLRDTWRSLLATAAMTATLVLSGLGWHAASGSDAELARTLLTGVAAGALSYAVVLLGLWVAAGGPPGPENDLVRLASTLFGRLASRLRAGKAGIIARRTGSGT